FDTHLRKQLTDLWSAAVDDHRIHADQFQHHDIARESGLEMRLGHRVAAVLDDDGPIVKAPYVRQRLGQHLRLHIRIDGIDREWKRQDTLRHVASEWALFRALRARDYELLIHLTEHPRGLTFARLLRPRYAVTRERDGRAPLWRRRFTHFYKTPARTPRHTVETHLDALRRIGVYPGPGDKRLVLVPGADADAKIEALLARHRLVPGTFA